MDIDQYKNKVIDMFRDGTPTVEEWEELATLVLYASESVNEQTELIDARILGPLVTCEACGGQFYPTDGACPCHS